MSMDHPDDFVPSRQPEDVHAADVAIETSRQQLHRDRTILILDDCRFIAGEIREILADLGFARILMAHSLFQANEFANGKVIDLAILDFDLGNGECSEDLGIRLSRAGTSVLFVSGYARSELAPRIHGFDFLEKPFKRQDLVDQVLGHYPVSAKKKGGPIGPPVCQTSIREE